MRVSPLISRVLSGAYAVKNKRSCIDILQMQIFAADAPLQDAPEGLGERETRVRHRMRGQCSRCSACPGQGNTGKGGGSSQLEKLVMDPVAGNVRPFAQ